MARVKTSPPDFYIATPHLPSPVSTPCLQHHHLQPQPHIAISDRTSPSYLSSYRHPLPWHRAADPSTIMLEGDAKKSTPPLSYFNAFHYSLWELTAYLDYTLADSLVSNITYDQAIDSYTKALEGITTADQEKHKKAQELLRDYRQGDDRQLGRDWRDRHRGKTSRDRRSSSSSLVITNSQVLIGRNGCQVALGDTPQVHGNQKPKPKSKSKSKKKRKQKDDIDDESDAVAESIWTPSSFIRMFHEMEENSMWKLPSGAYVENILYNNLYKADYECLGHSFIIDVNSIKIKNLFEPVDWKAIIDKVPSWPTIDTSAVEFMGSFMDVQTAATLRQRLDTTPYMPPGESYDREKHYDRYWIHMVITMLVPLFENPDKPLLRNNDECWYDIRVWGIIIDTILDDISGLITRRELPLVAGANRKNRHRENTSKRQKIGARFDGLVQDGCNQYEYAAMEGSKVFVNQLNTKWLHDYHKVAKALHDMLYRLQSAVGNEVTILEKLHLAGTVSAGLHCQVLRMSYASGYVCLLNQDTLCQVPQTENKFSLLFQLLSSILRMKKILKDSKALIDSYPGTRSLEHLVEPARLTSSQPKIPMSCDSENEPGEDV